jgi:hypothetical protein
MLATRRFRWGRYRDRAGRDSKPFSTKPAQTKSRFNFILNYRGLLPAISTDCGLVAGLAEMLHKNAEPAAKRAEIGY